MQMDLGCWLQIICWIYNDNMYPKLLRIFCNVKDTRIQKPGLLQDLNLS